VKPPITFCPVCFLLFPRILAPLATTDRVFLLPDHFKSPHLPPLFPFIGATILPFPKRLKPVLCGYTILTPISPFTRTRPSQFPPQKLVLFFPPPRTPQQRLNKIPGVFKDLFFFRPVFGFRVQHLDPPGPNYSPP